MHINLPPSLTDTALLTTIKIGSWSTRRKNKTVSNAAANALQTDPSAVEGFINLLPKNAMKPIQQAATELRQAHKRFTLPWFVSGTRLLPLARLEDHRREVSTAETNYQQAVENFLLDYPNYIQQAQSKLGSLFDANKYPSPEELRDRLAAQHVVTRLTMPDELSGILPDNDQLVQATENAYREALGEALQAGLQHVEGIVTNLKDYVCGEKKRLHESIVQAANGLARHVDAMASLLPTDDPLRRKYESLSAALSRLTELTADEIRHSDTAKDTVRRVADDVSVKLAEIDSTFGL